MAKIRSQQPGWWEQIHSKAKNYMYKKYGVDSQTKVKEIRDKARATKLERYGTDVFFGGYAALINHNRINIMYQGSHEKKFLDW